MNEQEAIAAAEAYGREHLTGLGERTWRATAFEGGWLCNPEGDDLRRLTGVACLIVLDDGVVHRESSSMAPSMLIAKYTTGTDGG